MRSAFTRGMAVMPAPLLPAARRPLPPIGRVWKVCEREVRHFVAQEWALSADDILWRRSKFGLHLDAVAQAALADWLAGELSGPVRAEDAQTIDAVAP